MESISIFDPARLLVDGGMGALAGADPGGRLRSFAPQWGHTTRPERSGPFSMAVLQRGHLIVAETLPGPKGPAARPRVDPNGTGV